MSPVDKPSLSGRGVLREVPQARGEGPDATLQLQGDAKKGL